MSKSLEEPQPGTGLLGFREVEPNGNEGVRVVAVICVLSLVLGGAAIVWPAFLKWLPVLLLALPVCGVLLAAAWVRVYRRRCLSCGRVPPGSMRDLAPCPLCGELYGDREGMLVESGTLPLARYLSHPGPPVRTIGLILALAIRDKACEVRFVRERALVGESLWLAQGNLWQVWSSTDDGSFEVIPPPRELAPAIFAIFRHVVRSVQREPNGGAHFEIPLREHRVEARLSIEQSNEQQVARFVLQKNVPEAGLVAEEWLKKAYRPGGTGSHVPSRTSRTELPQIPGRLCLHDLRSSDDPHLRRLADALDFALDCQKEEFEFVEDNEQVLAHWSKEGVRTQVPKNGRFDSLRCLELLAEIQKQVGQESDGNEARFQIVGSLHQAATTLLMKETDGKRWAMLQFDYDTTISS